MRMVVQKFRRPGQFGVMALCVALLVACGSARGDDIAWHPVREAVSTLPSTPEVAVTTATTATTPTAAANARSHPLTAAELQKYQPDELGLVPIPMYHAFVKDNESKTGAGGGDNLDQWTRTLSEFRADLQWYYDHDFYVVPMKDYVADEMRVPAGKHPMVLTFDDASTRQAMWIKNKQGQIVPDPQSALGVMEDFYTKHPDFGRGGYFAVLIFNCFNNPDGPPEMADCATKLNWLIDHGYEIGNHTWGHQDLTDITDDEFLYQVGKPVLWFRANVEDKGDRSDVLTLPYGAYPDRSETEQWNDLVNGFWYHGQQIVFVGILQVNGGPALSPSSDKFDRYGIARYNTDPDVMSYWWKRIANGQLAMYTSDGDPDTITVPDTLPDSLAGQLDPDLIASNHKKLITYHLKAHATAPPKTPAASPAAAGIDGPGLAAADDRRRPAA